MGTCVSLQCSLNCCICLKMSMFYKYPPPSQVPLQLWALLSLPFLKWWSAPCCLVFLTPHSILTHSSLSAHPTPIEVSAVSFWVKPANPDIFAASGSVDRSLPFWPHCLPWASWTTHCPGFSHQSVPGFQSPSLPGPAVLALWGSV